MGVFLHPLFPTSKYYQSVVFISPIIMQSRVHIDQYYHARSQYSSFSSAIFFWEDYQKLLSCHNSRCNCLTPWGLFISTKHPTPWWYNSLKTWEITNIDLAEFLIPRIVYWVKSDKRIFYIDLSSLPNHQHLAASDRFRNFWASMFLHLVSIRCAHNMLV